MEITKTKTNSFVVSTRQVDLTINPTEATKSDVILLSKDSIDISPKEDQFVFDGPGEYEVKNTMIDAVACSDSTAFVVTAGDLRLSYLDNEQAIPSEKEIEDLGGADILIIKVYGDKIETLTKLISSLEPSIVIPFGYTDDQLKQLSAEFGKEVSTMPKLKIAKKDINPEDQQLIVLE